MTKPAQRPPSALERVQKTTAELLMLALSALAGVAGLYVLLWLGVVPDGESARASAILQGPILLAIAGLSYLLLERALATESDPARPLELHERAGFGLGVLTAAGAIVVAMVGSVLLALAQQYVLSIEAEEQALIVELVERGDTTEIAMLGLSAVILAPITEELLYRHMFFRRLRQRAGPLAAWTLPALAFGLSHGNLAGLLMYAWLGTVFAMAYALSGRLWVAMLAHAGYNALAFTMLLNAPELLP